MIDEPFSLGTSRIHRLDPRFRIVSAAFYCITVALLYQFSALCSALLISILLTLTARLNFREVYRRLKAVFWFLFLIWLMLPITFEGDALYKLGFVTITRPGVILSAQITMKSFAILLALMATISTMPTFTLGHALNRLYVHEKFVHLFLITYRYIFVIEQEYHRLWTAIKIRGFCPGTNMHSYKTFAYMIGMLFVRASVRAERVSQAMRCRGFNGRFHSLDRFPASSRNWLFAVAMAIVIGWLIFLELQ